MSTIFPPTVDYSSVVHKAKLAPPGSDYLPPAYHWVENAEHRAVARAIREGDPASVRLREEDFAG